MVAMPTSQSIAGFPGTSAAVVVMLVVPLEVLLDGAHDLSDSMFCACAHSMLESMTIAPAARSDCASICALRSRRSGESSIIKSDGLEIILWKSDVSKGLALHGTECILKFS
jgi:hypothetical protein